MPTFTKKPLTAMVVMLTLLPGTAALANEFSLAGNQINVDGTGAVALDANGAFANISTDINSPVPTNIPDIEFTLENNNTTSGQYDLRLGLVIQQQGSNNRLESVLGVIRVTVDGSGTITSITLPNTENVEVTVRRGSATLNYSNNSNAGILTTTGASVTISAAAISQQLIGSDPVFADLVNALAEDGHYNYRVTLQPTGTDASVGTTHSGSFTPLARMQTSCSLDTASTSAFTFTMNYADRFPAAYAAHGVISLGGATSPSSGFSPLTEACEDVLPPDVPPVPEVNDAVGAAQNATTLAEQAIAANDQEAVVEHVEDAIAGVLEAVQLLTEQSVEEGSANQQQLLTVIQTLDSLAETLENAQQELDLDLSDQVAEINNTLVNVLELLTEKIDTLDVLNRLDIEQAVTQVVAANNAAHETSEHEATVTDALRIKIQLERLLMLQATLAVRPTEVQANEQSDLNSYLINALQSIESPLQRLVFQPFQAGYENLLGDVFQTYRVNERTPNLLAIDAPDQPGAIRDSDGLVTARGEDGRVFRYQFTGVAFVPEGEFEDGLYNAPNGALFSVDDGVIIEFAAAPANLAAFNSSITGMGYSIEYERAGIANILLDNGERVSAAFRFEDMADTTGNCTQISFVEPSGHPASADYVFIAECNNGISQALVPVVLDQALYDTLAYSGLTLLNSRDTGYLQVGGVGVFRPDFFVQPLGLNERIYFNANKNQEGIALQAGDFDGNGTIDYRVLSERGVQTLWGL